MTSAKHPIKEAHEHHKGMPINRSAAKRGILEGWLRKCAAAVGFSSMSIGLVIGVVTLFARANTTIYTDPHLRIRKLEEDRFAFQLGLTLDNQGAKADKIGLPNVDLTTSMPIVQYSRNHDFTDAQGRSLLFPVIVPRESSLQILFTVEWTPTEEYDKWTSEV